MKTVLSLILFSIKENFKTKLYLVLLLFSLIMIFIGLLLTGLSGFEQPQRVLVDTGIAMIELFCILVVLLNSAGLLLQDIESKSIHLLLSKPVSRDKYVVSKYLGLLGVTIINVCVMAVFHIIFLKISKWSIDIGYFMTLTTIILKTSIITAISLFLVLTMTSQTAAVITSLLLWIAGHFLTELKFMIDKINILWVKILLKIIYYLIPNFQYFNIKDFFEEQYFVSQLSIGYSILYLISYISVLMFLTIQIFKKKNL